MKRIFAILFLFSFMLFGIGYFHFLCILRLEARHEIKSRMEKEIPDNELSIVIFQPGEKIDWVKEYKEFRFENHLYDVVRASYVNGTAIYYCIDDRKEHQVLALMEKHLIDGLQNDRTSPNVYLILVNLFPVLINSGDIQLTVDANFVIDLGTFYNIKTLEGYPDISTPPPVIC